MNAGPEFTNNWRHTWTVDGVEVEVFSLHRTVRRVPRGHEIATQFARRGRFDMVEDTNRGFRAGMHVFEGHSVTEAAEAAARRISPGVFPDRAPSGSSGPP